MSEFKFACPVCGQHITADASTTGGQIDCPTCFQKIVVPQAPASPDTKLILSAAQVAKARPASPEAALLDPGPPGPARPPFRRGRRALPLPRSDFQALSPAGTARHQGLGPVP